MRYRIVKDTLRKQNNVVKLMIMQCLSSGAPFPEDVYKKTSYSYFLEVYSDHENKWQQLESGQTKEELIEKLKTDYEKVLEFNVLHEEEF